MEYLIQSRRQEGSLAVSLPGPRAELQRRWEVETVSAGHEFSNATVAHAERAAVGGVDQEKGAGVIFVGTIGSGNRDALSIGSITHWASPTSLSTLSASSSTSVTSVSTRALVVSGTTTTATSWATFFIAS